MPPSLAPSAPPDAKQAAEFAGAELQPISMVVLPQPSAEDCVRVMHALAGQDTPDEEISAEQQLAAVRTAAKRPSMLLHEYATEPAADQTIATVVPVLEEEQAANDETVEVAAAPADAVAPTERDIDNAPEQDAPHQASTAKLDDMSVAAAKEALAAAKAANEADGPARRTRRRVSISTAAPPPPEATVPPSRSAAAAGNKGVSEARAAIAAAKAASSQEGSVLRTRKRLSMSVSADVDSVREAQASRLAAQTEEANENHDEEDADEFSPTENACGSTDAENSGHGDRNAPTTAPDEDAAPQRPMTRRRRASIAVNTAPVEVAGGPRSRRKRDESVAVDAEAPRTKGVQSEQVPLEPTGRSTRARARHGAATAQQASGDTPVQPAQHVSTGEEPAEPDTPKTRRGATKRGRAALVAGSAPAPDAVVADGNVSDSEGPVTRRRRAKAGAVPAESGEVTEASGEVWGSKRKRGKRGNKAVPEGDLS